MFHSLLCAPLFFIHNLVQINNRSDFSKMVYYFWRTILYAICLYKNQNNFINDIEPELFRLHIFYKNTEAEISDKIQHIKNKLSLKLNI